MSQAAETTESSEVSSSEKVDALGRTPLFTLLDTSERAALAERIDFVKVAKGKTLFTYGDPGDSMYIVLSGAVELWFKNNTGEKIVLETATEGHFFGEVSLLDGGSRNASATVTEDLEALIVDRGDLDEFLKIKPTAAMDLLTATGKRLRETSRLLRHTASRNAPLAWRHDQASHSMIDNLRRRAVGLSAISFAISATSAVVMLRPR